MEEVSLLASGLRFPEGPVFDLSGRLWCAEQEGEGVVCLHTDGQLERLPTGGRPCGMTLDQAGNIWFCDSGQNAIRRLNPDTKHIETVVDRYNGKPLNRPNDLIFDRSNNLIFTCPGPPAEEGGLNKMQGMVLVLMPNGSLHVVADELDYSNGLVFLVDSDTLLIAETQKQRIWSGFWDGNSPAWDTIDVWANTGEVSDPAFGPDGMTVGPDGYVYVAIFGEGTIKVFDADGQLIRTIRLPGKQPTNCICDPGRQFLVVSETERGELLQVRI